MRENRPSGSEGGARSIPCPYPYRGLRPHFGSVGYETFRLALLPRVDAVKETKPIPR